MPVYCENDDNVTKANKVANLIPFLERPIRFERNDLVIDYYTMEDMPEDLKIWTFELVKTNMYDMYMKSNDGWDEEQKKKEMRVPEMRYIIARAASNPLDLMGFVSFQILHEETMDDDIMAQAAYCFELQLVPNARNQGLGEFLMQLLERIGSYWKMDKVMLTVFKANKGAIRFYMEKLGFTLDEISPGACLSALQARRFDYEILSKPCNP